MKKIKNLGEWRINEVTHCYKMVVDSRPDELKAALVHADFVSTSLRIEVLKDGKLRIQPDWLTSVLIDPSCKELSIRTSKEALTSEEWETKHSE